ncbi:XrtA/PEP-CTERM system histidine kinase PrsK [Erythrobacter sp.]|uniref:XrtA/PEP-CTERM system histidine kinase PrsK n=1 Tax=Erythrobacter sp. TaxID=1042 RepID=UPI001B0077DA|nr:XrtA/PEP-CTERM system histidine kinase PrsK [Erythrobacter sp.]MBO6526836.1 PEP-CTERM system histidine kinase PrsK [Erythrobacter sp.]MBO6528509.1 PEP-CTERM system histidine kinase PrsK [Erythrobacter sp.]
MGWMASLSYVAYTLGAIVCALAAIWIARKGDQARSDRTPAIVALALTANWCFAAASFEPGKPIVELTEIARNLAWLFTLFRLFANDGRDETLRVVRPAVAALAFVEVLQFALLLLAYRYAVTGEIAELIFETAALFRVMVAVGALVLLHNLYVGAAASSRLILRWNVAALAGLWAFDLNYFTIGYIVGSVPAELAALRGIAAAVVAVPFALGYTGTSSKLEFRPSRAATFRFLSLLVIGAYFGLMLALARSLDMLTGDLARMTQVGLIIAAGALALIWLPSNRLRGWLRVTAIKHLFKHRYDYRNEWIRFTRTIGSTGFDNTTLQERAVKALADITDSPSGILLVPDDDSGFEIAANWRWPDSDIPARAAPAALGYVLERSELIIDLDEVREGIDHHGEQALVPDWMHEDRRAWAAVPLLHFDRLIGLAVLARPVVARKLDWEDFDLLAVVGRQLASYLAEQAGQAALLEAGRFDEFNRRMAFVMHDIKNLSSQMSLLLRNAEKHADKPEFRKDMLVTLRNSTDKLNSLLARLGRYGTPESEKSSQFDLAEAAQKVADRLDKTHPVTMLRAEPVKVEGNREALDQALVHLVQNAVDASEADSAVMIEAYSDGVSGKVTVIDNGCGMSPQFLRNGLFKPFVSSKTGGFGIGAFEARELIRSMGGRLDVQSREGLGSRFTVSLPLKAAASIIGRGRTNRENEVA